MGSNGGGVCCRPATGWLSTRLPGKARGLPPAPKAESLLLKKNKSSPCDSDDQPAGLPKAGIEKSSNRTP